MPRMSSKRGKEMTKQNNLEEICQYKLLVADPKSSTGDGMRRSIREHGKYSKAYQCLNNCTGYNFKCKEYKKNESY